MAEFTLVAEPPLAGFEKSFGNNVLRASSGLAAVAMSIPLGEAKASATALKGGLGVDMPVPGLSVLAKHADLRLLRLSQDQLLALFNHNAPDAEQVVSKVVGGAFYLTDQTDALVALELEGPEARVALARICPLDLHPDVFVNGAGARTMMEHLSVTIIRAGVDRYLLLSASSSAQSFLHAVETSLENVL